MSLTIRSSVWKHPLLSFPQCAELAGKRAMFGGRMILCTAPVFAEDGSVAALDFELFQYCFIAEQSPQSGEWALAAVSRGFDRDQDGNGETLEEAQARWDAWPFPPGMELTEQWQRDLKAKADERVDDDGLGHHGPMVVEGDMIRRAPLAAIIFVVLAFFAAKWASDQQYEGKVSGLDGVVSTKEAEIDFLDKRLSEYEERPGNGATITSRGADDVRIHWPAIVAPRAFPEIENGVGTPGPRMPPLARLPLITALVIQRMSPPKPSRLSRESSTHERVNRTLDACPLDDQERIQLRAMGYLE